MNLAELILNKDGSIYHLHLQPEQVAQKIITVGDPERVGEVSKRFDRIDIKASHREFVTHTGELNGQRLTVISTGIGTDNVDIVLNEIDALVNLDLKEKRPKDRLTKLDFYRIGTSGSLQDNLDVDTFLVSEFGIGYDSLMLYYDLRNSDEELSLQTAFKNEYATQLPFTPYVVKADNELLSTFEGWKRGITITCPGFYGPQGRRLRAARKFPRMLDVLDRFSWENKLVTNFEMETAGIYGLASLLGHRAISLNAILANRKSGDFSQQPNETIELLIDKALEVITKTP